MRRPHPHWRQHQRPLPRRRQGRRLRHPWRPQASRVRQDQHRHWHRLRHRCAPRLRGLGDRLLGACPLERQRALRLRGLNANAHGSSKRGMMACVMRTARCAPGRNWSHTPSHFQRPTSYPFRRPHKHPSRHPPRHPTPATAQASTPPPCELLFGCLVCAMDGRPSVRRPWPFIWEDQPPSPNGGHTHGGDCRV